MTALACVQPACAGTINDGYCDICGVAPRPSAKSPSGASQSRPSGDSRRGQLGAGLVDIPPIPAINPTEAVTADPQVPEGGRFCSSCGQAVGRGSAPARGRTEGFCKNCGTRFSFRPRLRPGELVAGQYEVLGCLAHGGLGWIYLARDRNVCDRWVVLKGLLNYWRQRRAWRRRRRASVPRRGRAPEHRRDLQLRAACEGTASSGYIVMEYVGGQRCKQIVQRARARRTNRFRWRRRSRTRRDPARSRLPAPLGTSVLRLQAGQRHPGR